MTAPNQNETPTRRRQQNPRSVTTHVSLEQDVSNRNTKPNSSKQGNNIPIVHPIPAALVPFPLTRRQRYQYRPPLVS